jgi:hypothetical protein
MMLARRGFIGWVQFLLVTIIALSAAPAMAQAKAEPHATASSGEFSVMALITADPDWVKEWSRTDGQPPRLVPASKVTLGETAQVLVLFSGARPVDGRLQVECDVSVTLPDGTGGVLPPSPCFDRPLDGPSSAVRLLDIDMGVNVEPADPSGLYGYTIRATDKGSGNTVRVNVSVEVVSEAGN